MNGRAFSRNFGKEDNLASYTQIFRIFLPGIRLHLIFCGNLRNVGWLVSFLEIQQFPHFLEIFSGNLRTIFVRSAIFGIFGWMKSSPDIWRKLLNFRKVENSEDSWRKVNWNGIPGKNFPKISVGRYTSQGSFEISEIAVPFVTGNLLAIQTVLSFHRMNSALCLYFSSTEAGHVAELCKMS